MGQETFEKGLHEIGDGTYAYLLPNGSWGWSNAGLIVDGEATLLVDTLYTLGLTGEMLTEMRRRVPAAERIDTLVNSHADGDHTWGNQLVRQAEIIASERAAADMRGERTPERVRQMLERADELGLAGRFLAHVFEDFDFRGIELVHPNRTFTGSLELQVGDRRVELLDVGPAHSSGDVLVHVPDARVMYTGDILFIGGHPIVWSGPIGNWIAACDRILEMDVDRIVPGHGPVTDKAGVRQVRDYLAYVLEETRKRYEAGMPPLEAAHDIDMSAYDDWTDGERIVVSVDSIYRELGGDATEPDRLTLFAEMGRILLGEQDAGRPAG